MVEVTIIIGLPSLAGVVLIIWAIHYFLVLRRNLTILYADLVRLLSKLNISWRGLRRAGTGKEIKGYLERSIKRINNEVDGVLPNYIKIKFVEEENREEFFREGTIVLRVKRSKERKDNIINATNFLLERGLLKYSRLYIHETGYKASKLMVGKRIISEIGEDYLLEEYFDRFIKPEFDRSTVISTHLENMERLEEMGLFTRVLLYELSTLKKFYPKVQNTKEIRADTFELLNFLTDLAFREREEIIKLYLQTYYIAIGIVLVGKSETRKDFGAGPYLKAFENYLKYFNLDRIYLLARGGENNRIAERVGAYFENKKDVSRVFGETYPEPASNKRCFCGCYSVLMARN